VAQYNVYVSGTNYTIEANPNEKLNSVRQKVKQKVGSETDNYRFVYYDSFTEKKTILGDQGVESKRTLQNLTFPGNTVIMTVVEGKKTDLFGMKTDWLYSQHAGVQIVLNESDAVARQKNAGKFQPIMLTDVQASNPLSNAYYDRVVICEKSSVIQFNISSWGAAGFGYEIRSERETINGGLYVVYGNSPNRQGTVTSRRYSDSNNSIQIESAEQLNIPSADVIHYQKITVKTWRITSYSQDGKIFQSNTEAPVIEAPPSSRMNFTASEFGMRLSGFQRTGGFEPGEPGGDIYVPGKDIQTGVPGRGPASEQTFGVIGDVIDDYRHNKFLGAVVFYFFVFQNREAANRVINVLNAPDPNAIS